MSDDPFSTKRMIMLRKLTRAIAGALTTQVREYLDAIAPMLRPRAVLGDFIENIKEQVTGGEGAFKDIQTLYEKCGGPRKFPELAQRMEKPIDLSSSAVEINPVEYSHVARMGKESKTILITSPLRWTITFEGYSPKRFEKIRSETTRTSNKDIFEFYLHYITLNIITNHQPRLTRLLETLHFPVSTGNSPAMGELPLTLISSKIATLRPPDEVIIENTEVSGMNVFEEVVNVEDIGKLRDPLRDRLVDLAKAHGVDVDAIAATPETADAAS